VLLLCITDVEEVPALGHDHSRSFAAQKSPLGAEADGPILLPRRPTFAGAQTPSIKGGE